MKNVFKKVIEVHGCDHVQCAWLSTLSWKMQTVINQGSRAPDTHYCRAIKLMCRWIRSVVLQNADKNHTFMCQKKELPKIEDIENEINYCSTHFATHFVYALEIISYKHPEKRVNQIAMNYYRGIIQELWHFNIETEVQLDIRLADVDRKPVKKCPKDEQRDAYLRSY